MELLPGAAAVMAADLAGQTNRGLTVQLCGDAHILNFGLWATPERNLLFDLRDFDETLPGPFEWDVMRFAASVVVAARENRIKPRRAEDAVTAGVRAYCRRMRGYATMPERQVFGVGRVGMRVYLLLLEGRSGADPLFLQAKQAGPAVYEAHTQPSQYDNHGARVINGKRLTQSATDIFVGWSSFQGHDYYVRQFLDMKIIPTTELIAPVLTEFATACGEALARAHARTGDPLAIDAYIGNGAAFTAAVSQFARLYADQNEPDHAQLVSAIAAGAVECAPDSV
jgi:uncharacterized protein (DUF2252 family)